MTKVQVIHDQITAPQLCPNHERNIGYENSEAVFRSDFPAHLS